MEKLIKISSLTGGLLVYCGILKLIFFYRAFNIPIVDFLSFTEIITSFLDDLNILILFGVIILIQTYTGIDVLRRKAKLTAEDFVTRLLLFLYPFRYRYVLAFALAIIFVTGLIYFDIVPLNYLTIYFILFCSVQLMTYLLMGKDEDGEIEFSNLAIGFILLVSVTSTIYLFAQLDINETKNNPLSVKIETNDYLIVCNDKTKNIYLGKTIDFVFIKLHSTQATAALPISEITWIEFGGTGLEHCSHTH